MVARPKSPALAQNAPGTPPVDPRKAAVVAILRVADRLHRRFAAVLEPSGLTVQQYNVLRILRGAMPEALPTMEIAARMIEHAPGITGLLDRLESKGLLTRARQMDDRRCVRCSITPRGLELLAGLDDPVSRADAESTAGLNDQEIDRLVELLARGTRE